MALHECKARELQVLRLVEVRKLKESLDVGNREAADAGALGLLAEIGEAVLGGNADELLRVLLEQRLAELPLCHAERVVHRQRRANRQPKREVLADEAQLRPLARAIGGLLGQRLPRHRLAIGFGQCGQKRGLTTGQTHGLAVFAQLPAFDLEPPGPEGDRRRPAGLRQGAAQDRLHAQHQLLKLPRVAAARRLPERRCEHGK